MSALSRTIVEIRKAKLMGGALSNNSIKALRALRRKTEIIGILVVAAMLAGVVITAYLSLTHVQEPDKIKAISAGIGLSLGVALTLLRQVWREWAQSSLLLILVENADEPQINRLFDTIVGKL